ncbi:MAG TPA: purine-nucleoside phosphorylase [Bacteroidales bacterium]|nr:purine-nucleoside phosphorylase [Bacteroidales bacterium]
MAAVEEDSMDFTFEYFKTSSDYIKSRIGDFEPEIGMILGSGLGGVAGLIEQPVDIAYNEIPNFLLSTAPGHDGKLIFGSLEGRDVVCMSGRFHYYEGYDYEQLVIPVRVLKLLGIKLLIVTNAAGAINKSYNVGDVMIISDHIKFSGASPLRGKNVEEFGPRFFDNSNTYPEHLRAVARECAKNAKLTVREGVYFFFGGPQFESPAEIRAARLLGGDAAGMSTVTEALTAAHCGLPVLGLSLMTNMAAGVLDIPLSGDDVNATAERVGPLFQEYFIDIIRSLPK